MVLGLLASFIGGLFGWLMGLLSVFLILLVLVQRGRGGGLTGALGGPGGQSAFGSKAGDMFTRITFVVAGVWILLCALAMWSLGNARSVVAVPPEGVVGETGPAGGVVPAREGDAAAPGATPDLSGLGDLSELLNQSAGDAPDAEATDAEATDAEATDAEAAPAEEPAAEEAPVVEPAAEEAPAEEASAEEAPAEEAAPAADPS
ncbi:preprotein translocase subunit SecG [Candidatus Laterigemmans baculatus]|uniref:preprotein translocase subunit SecG n=1 Tax=Candidatus Laterigemmans baculatus TaxID=2770505 RepID=UPI0013DA6F98|nr:preprotein translocase subunit SecG [Candidatus Laterigemmans baculatus]